MASLPKPRKGARNSLAASNTKDGGLWDRPKLMNILAELLFTVGGFLLLWSAVIYLQQLPVFSLRHIVLANPAPQVSQQQIEYVAKTVITGNFFTVDLTAARIAFQALPWVRKAELRRVWPNMLELTLEEHQALAHWTPHEGEARLVNSYGEVFVATRDGAEESIKLPEFDGPEDSAARVLERFQLLNLALRPLARVPARLRLSPREAWQVVLDDGLILELGRDQTKQQVADRLARFVAAYPIVQSRTQTSLKVIDMRYPNGFALRARGKA